MLLVNFRNDYLDYNQRATTRWSYRPYSRSQSAFSFTLAAHLYQTIQRLKLLSQHVLAVIIESAAIYTYALSPLSLRFIKY
jgi:hypothetical protein